MQTFFRDRDQHVGGNGDPYLRLDRVLAGAEKNLDPQMLLDPFEEQLDLPALLVKRRDYVWLQCKVVGQKREALSGLVLDHDATQRGRIVFARTRHRQHASLIADDIGRGAIDEVRITPCELRIAFGSRDEEGAHQVQFVQPPEIQIRAIHQVKRARFDRQFVEPLDVVSLPVGDVNKAGNRSFQIEQRMQFDCRFGGSKRRPRIHRQTQIDRCRVERIDRCVQVHAHRLVGIQRAGDRDQMLGEIGIDLPRTCGIRVRQRVARNRLAPKSHVIQAMRLRTQIDFDIAQRLPISQLSKRHGEELIEARKIFDLVFASMRCDATPKGRQWKVGHDLRENESALMHASLRRISAKSRYFESRRSNRDQTNASIYSDKSLTYEILA